MAVYGRGEIRIQRISIKRPVPVEPAANPAAAPVVASSETATLERTPV